MIKHTPGPWHVMERKFKGTFAVYATGEELIYTAMVGDYSILGVKLPNKENAHLVSAAPEMYDALKELIWWNAKRGSNDEILPDDRQDAEVLKAMRAIRKAEGVV